jgi:hypothetical protein
VQFHRLAHQLEIEGGSNRAELRGPITPRIRSRPTAIPRTGQGTEGLEVEPEDRFVVHAASGDDPIGVPVIVAEDERSSTAGSDRQEVIAT